MKVGTFGVIALVLAAFAVYVLEAEPRWYERLRYPLRYEQIVVGHAENYHLDPQLVAAVIYQESKFDADAVSASGAVGLMQLLPETGQGIADRTGGNEWKPEDLRNPELNVRYGSWYLRHLLDKYGDESLALAAYNAGQTNVDRWRSEGVGIQFDETRHYVRRVQELKAIYADAYRSELGLSKASSSTTGLAVQGTASRSQRFWSIRRTGQSVAVPPKSSAPAANTFAPAAVS